MSRIEKVALVIFVLLIGVTFVAVYPSSPSTCCSDAAVLGKGVQGAYNALEGDGSHQAVRARAILKSAARATGTPLEGP